MIALDKTKEEIFSSCKNILQQLHDVSSADDLLKYEDSALELFRNISFLSKLEEISPKSDNPSELVDFQLINENISVQNKENLPEMAPEADIVPEPEDFVPQQDNPEEKADKQPSDKEEVMDSEHSERVSVQENIIVEDNPILHNETQEEDKAQAESQKRFKLAQIKNLSKNQPSLFADEFSQEIPETPKAQPSPEAFDNNNAKPAFRLDLNDRIAFTQKLFGGSQIELNDAVQKLNSCTNAEEAKEYLSDLYYEKNWKKADDYAQRLWMLVENKFL